MSQPWNLAIFQDEFLKLFFHFYALGVPKWKIAHNWQSKEPKNIKKTSNNASVTGFQSWPDVLQHPVYVCVDWFRGGWLRWWTFNKSCLFFQNTRSWQLWPRPMTALSPVDLLYFIKVVWLLNTKYLGNIYVTTFQSSLTCYSSNSQHFALSKSSAGQRIFVRFNTYCSDNQITLRYNKH